VRVGLWCPCLGLGGAETWQLALAEAVDPRRIVWQGAVVTEGRGVSDPRMERELRRFMPVGYGLKDARTLASACDVIVSWAVTSLADLTRGIDPDPSVVVACHFPAESPWGPGTESLLEAADRFVAVSELAAESVPSTLRDRVEVIWNAVDARRLGPTRDRDAMRNAWGVPREAPVVGFLGRLSPEKDPDAMLRLAEYLPDPWNVVLVGEGSERPRLVQALRDRDLQRVHVAGGDPGIGDVLGAFDTLVVPSHYESFGLTIAEGLWAGVPVIATPCGLAKLKPGLVREVAVGDPGPGLAQAVLADRSDRTGTSARIERAQAFARSMLGLSRFGREWTDLILSTHQRKRLP
jgi:glycosyltransferase involved in cell wall biosynthesis